MRGAFIRSLLTLAERDPRVWLLTGDLGYSVLEPFMQRFPERFVNVGVAEQNMIGVAAGLAHSGKIPFVYSIANFPTLRCYEQIRNDVCYHELPARIVSVGAGVGYGTAGYTHHGVEDVAVMRALPGMTVLSPGDTLETEQAVLALADLPGPAYLRLGKAAAAPADGAEFSLGRAARRREGTDLTLLVGGSLLSATLDAAAEVERALSVTVRVLSLHTLKPLDAAAIRAAALETRLIVTVEEHSVVGGLGSAVADVVATLPGARAQLSMYALADAISGRIGSPAYLLAELGTLSDHVCAAWKRLPRSN